MNFVDASKKKINPNAKENEKYEWKCFQFFEQQESWKNWWSLLVILINTSFHYGIIWIKMWYPRGHDFEKSNKPFDHTYSGNWLQNSWFRNSFSNSLEIRQQKRTSFWKNWYLVIWYASRLATVSNLPNLFNEQNKIPRSWYPEITLINVLGHIDRELPIFLKHFWAITLFVDSNGINNFGPKSQKPKQSSYKKNASTWRAIYGVHYCPE